LQVVKKLIAVIIVISLLFVCVSPVFAATKTSIPTVYVAGQTKYIYSDKDDIDSELYITDALPEGALNDILGDLGDPLFKGLMTSNWDDYCDAKYNAVTPVFAEIALDENGLPKNNTGYDCLRETEIVDKAVNGRYGLYDYRFYYDWRLDPCAIADELNEYIQAVKDATGAGKVNLVGRCLGYSEVLAYLYEYGCDDINEIGFYCVGLDGVDVCGAMFSGRLALDADALTRFVDEADFDNFLLNYIKSSVGYLNGNGVLSDPLKLVERIYGKIYENVIPRVLRENFATMPGYWSMVGDEYYEDAIDLNFGDYDTAQTYSVLLEKINHFHYDIMNNGRAILEEAMASGVNIYNIVKYGNQLIPITENCNVQSDQLISVYNQTWGATSADYGEDTLSEEYIAHLAETGTTEFVSPDVVIDASTGFIPGHTWFIKNLNHHDMPECADELLAAIFNYNGYTTVFDLDEYPQYLYCSDDLTNISPLSESGSSDYADTDTTINWGQFLTFNGIFEFIRNIIYSFTSLILQIIRAAQGN